MYWVLMTVLFLSSGMTWSWHFQIEFHVQGFCPFAKFVKIFMEHSCDCLKLKSYIHYGVISNCGTIVWNVVNVNMNRHGPSTGPCWTPGVTGTSMEASPYTITL